MFPPFIGIILGFLFGLVIPYEIPHDLSPYVAIAILTCLDSIFGGLRAHLQDNFKFHIFYSGFLTNAILAVLLILMGEKLLGISLQLAVIVVYGTRLFKNFTAIRLHFLEKKQNEEIL